MDPKLLDGTGSKINVSHPNLDPNPDPKRFRIRNKRFGPEFGSQYCIFALLDLYLHPDPDPEKVRESGRTGY
jgi:hypothetical protein